MEPQAIVSQPTVPLRINLNIIQIKKISNDLYDINAVKIKELNGYDDKNYLICDEKGENFVLKIINSVDSEKPEIFEAQSLLLIYLGNHGIHCPKPIKTKNGKLFEKYSLDSGEHIVRLLKYIDGTILMKVPHSSSLLYQIGETTARMNNVMKNFKHSAYDSYHSIWMLKSVPYLNPFVDAVKDEKRKQMVQIIIKEFIERVLPVNNILQKGLIHGDINEQNIIVDEEEGNYRIKAIIDYGDCHIGCYLYELAITMTYMIILAKDIAAGKHVLSGYSSVRKVNDLEYSLLKLCIAARFCQSLVLGAYTHQQDPKNTYVLTTAEYGWPLLEKLWEQPNDELLKMWKTDEPNNEEK